MAVKTHVVQQTEGATERTVQILSADPGSPVTDQVWYNSTEKQLKTYDGANTVIIGIQQLSADPGSPQNGEAWINTTTEELKYRFGGATVVVSGGGGGGGVLPTTVVTGTSQTAAANNAYIADNAAKVDFTMPATAAVGDRVEIIGEQGFTVIANTGQTIHDVGGASFDDTQEIESEDNKASILLICTVANTEYLVLRTRGQDALQSLDFGYVFAGNDGAFTGVIERLSYPDETRTTVGVSLSPAKDELTSTQSSTNVYPGGGFSGTRRNEIDRFAKSTETVTATVATLPTGRNDLGGAHSATNGYYICGFDGATLNQLVSLDFGAETTATLGATLTNGANSGLDGASSSTIALIPGGNGGGTTIDKLTFASDTTANAGDTLDTSTVNFGTCENGDIAGYVKGGAAGLTAIQRLDFGTEAATTITATLDVGVRRNAGTNSDNTGYSIAGRDSVNVSQDAINDLKFADESSAAITAVLSAAKHSLTAGSV